MTDSEREILDSFIDSRVEIALERLCETPAYQEQCRWQEKSRETAEEILAKLKTEESLALRIHYEGEAAKMCLELDEAYIQGLRDGVKILALLGVFKEAGI